MKNPVKAILNNLGWKTGEAARNFRLGDGNLKEILNGIPAKLPDMFKVRLIYYLGMSPQEVEELNTAYIHWRNGGDAA